MRARTRDEVLERLLGHVRYEVLPTERVVDDVYGHLPAGATVTVTASPSKGLEATLDITERLAALGYDVVPHLAARMIAGPGHLAEIGDRLKQAGVDNVFVPAGDADPADGGYHGALELLEDLASGRHRFTGVGITGYPESHPSIHDDVTIQAMWDKRSHATQIVSNMTFDPALLASWVERIRGRGVQLPVLVGLPGPVERVKLLKMASKIGVGESARFLAKNGGLFARIATPGGYDPIRFLGNAAATLGRDEMNVAGLHLFTFNQVAETEAWRVRELEKLRDPAPRRRRRAAASAPLAGGGA